MSKNICGELERAISEFFDRFWGILRPAYVSAEEEEEVLEWVKSDYPNGLNVLGAIEDRFEYNALERPEDEDKLET